MKVTLTCTSCHWIFMKDDKVTSRPEVGEIVPTSFQIQRHRNSNYQQKFNEKTNPSNDKAGRVRGF